MPNLTRAQKHLKYSPERKKVLLHYILVNNLIYLIYVCLFSFTMTYGTRRSPLFYLITKT